MIKTLCIVLSIFTTSLLNAQSEWGLKTGPNISTLGKTGNGYKPQLGFHVGAFHTASMTENMKFQIELIYSMQGARDESIPEINNKYHYLNLPILINLKILEGIDLQFGQQTGYLLKGVIRDPLLNLNITNDLKRIDVGLLLGLAINMNQTMTGSVRYMAGVNNTVDASPGSDIKFQNKVWQLSVAISI